jgi:hypothetical protein
VKTWGVGKLRLGGRIVCAFVRVGRTLAVRVMTNFSEDVDVRMGFFLLIHRTPDYGALFGGIEVNKRCRS